MLHTLFLYSVCLIPACIWGALFFIRDPKKKHLSSIVFVICMGSFSLLPVWVYHFFFKEYSQEILSFIPLSLSLSHSILTFSVTILFLFFSILFFAVLYAILKNFWQTFLSFFAHSFHVGPIIFIALSLLILSGISSFFLDIPFLSTSAGVMIFAALLEEYMKHLIVPLIGEGKYQNINTPMVYSIYVGLAFSVGENILYLSSLPQVHISSIILLRSIMTTMGHMVFSGIFGYFYGKALFAKSILTAEETEKKSYSFLKVLQKYIKKEVLYAEELISLGLICASMLHIFYNASLALGFFIMPIMIIVFGYFLIEYLLMQKETGRAYGMVGGDSISEDSYREMVLTNSVQKHLEDIRKQDPVSNTSIQDSKTEIPLNTPENITPPLHTIQELMPHPEILELPATSEGFFLPSPPPIYELESHIKELLLQEKYDEAEQVLQTLSDKTTSQ